MSERSRASAPALISLLAILFVAASLRFWYAAGLPLSGDEVGVGVLQASGQAVTYADRLSAGIVPLAEVRGFIAYDPRFSSGEVLRSLREAGMHPPLYYLAVHCVLRFFGNDVATLRALSIVLSVAAVAVLYAIGRALAGDAAGLLAAALLAVAPYGVEYGSLVRPYPAAMLIALASTLLAVRLASRRTVALLATWALFSIAGFYTVYQYAFAFGCQLLHLALAWRRPRELGLLTALTVAVAVGFLPWLPSLETHLSDVTTNRYYFHHALDAWRVASELFVLNAPTESALARALVAIPLGVACIAGLAVLARRRSTRPFVFALAGYVAAYLGVEAWLGMSTATEPKFLFFAMPIALLMVAVALASLPLRFARIGAASAIAMLLAVSAVNCADRDRLTADREEAYVLDFRPLLDGDHPHRLLLLNTMQRRYLFPLAHAIRGSGDIYVMPQGDPAQIVPDDRVLTRYRELVLVDFYVDYEPGSFLDEAERRALAETLRAHGFAAVEQAASGGGQPRHSLVVFRRVSS